MSKEMGTEDSVVTERVLSSGPDAVFAAFGDAERLARWWGPAGFTNTFDRFEFVPQGRWVFTMHAPTGAGFANECVFREIVPGGRIVIEHVVKPWYLLTVTLAAAGDGTRLTWDQRFESAEMASRMRPLSTTANEQVLDRLEAVLAEEALTRPG